MIHPCRHAFDFPRNASSWLRNIASLAKTPQSHNLHPDTWDCSLLSDSRRETADVVKQERTLAFTVMETRSRGKCAFVREFQWILESLFHAGLGFWKEIADHGCSPQTEVMLCTCFCNFVFLKNDFYCSVTEVHLMGLNKTGGYWVEAEDERFWLPVSL